MDGILFLVLAALTSFVSIKLSYYGDVLSKQSKLGSACIGGLLIASVTSLPEFITSISAVILDNPSLSFGDILGSNMFNIFALSIYNLFFFKRFIFCNTKDNFLFEVIEECSTSALNDKEKYWIQYYNSCDPNKGYNLSFGGNSNSHSIKIDYTSL